MATAIQRVKAREEAIKDHEWAVKAMRAAKAAGRQADQVLVFAPANVVARLCTFHGFTRHKYKSVNVTTLMASVQEYIDICYGTK